MAVLGYAETVARIKASVYDPKNPLWRVYYRHANQRVDFQQAIVVDNKDPDGLGRLRVHFPLWGDDAVTGWVPMMRPFAGTDMGLFVLPEIEERVLCGFINANSSSPIVMHSLYTPKDKPGTGINKGNNRKIFKSPFGSTIVLDDTKGGERIEVYLRDGKMRMVLDQKTA
jgi:uncharacterized protein involved in type VI secretion and phage assembly